MQDSDNSIVDALEVCIISIYPGLVTPPSSTLSRDWAALDRDTTHS